MTPVARSLTITGLIIAMACLALNACTTLPVYEQSPQFQHGKFRNEAPRDKPGMGKMLSIMWRMITDKPDEAAPRRAIPVRALSQADLLVAPDNTLYRLGHSTILLKLAGEFWLTDPVFSERASPFQWLGPKRFHRPPIEIADLPPIKGVILSHDHYDHLDHAAILALDARTEHFITPLGVGDRLIRWGITPDKITQLDWWQQTRVGAINLVATPAQHFSGRGLNDGNETLWASWVIESPDFKVFFSGDTGYFNGFKAIGERFGPFDLTLMETGAYDPQWADIHMQPEQTMQAHLDLRGKTLLPIHNGTFDLALHNWYDPFERIQALAKDRGVALSTPVMGEAVSLQQSSAAAQSWWKTVRQD